jgi:HAD superfamily phosphatase (TIGR01668 family)
MRLKPTYIVERVTDINLEDLKNEQIKGLIFDLDNTLMPPKTGDYPQDIFQWLMSIKNDFKIVILSNNPEKDYVQKAGEIVGCLAYEKAGKPRKKAAVQALKDIELLPEQVAMVGDRPLTDIWVGQRLGMVTILVDPIMKKEEIEIIKFLRKLERLFVSPAKKIFSHHKKDL